MSRRRKALIIKKRVEQSFVIQLGVLWSVVSCVFYLSGLHSAAFLVWLMAALCRTKKGTSSLHFSKDGISSRVLSWRPCWTRQRPGGRVLELPLVRQEEMLCPCSPVTGCVSAGVWSTALEQTEVHETPLHRTWTAAQREKCDLRWGATTSRRCD